MRGASSAKDVTHDPVLDEACTKRRPVIRGSPIDAERGVISTSALALMLGIDPSTASRNLAGLERRGYIVRRRGAEDGRQTDVRLTARGKRTAEAVSNGWSHVVASLLERLPRPERPRIADALDTLARVLDGGGDR